MYVAYLGLVSKNHRPSSKQAERWSLEPLMWCRQQVCDSQSPKVLGPKCLQRPIIGKLLGLSFLMCDIYIFVYLFGQDLAI